MAKQLVQYKKFRSYSGPKIRGTVPFTISDTETRHVARAFWLTAKVETGAKFGAIVAYDGTGMTAGLDQHIAVYPKELSKEDYDATDDQGSLWKLLRRMETVDLNPQGAVDEEYRRALNWLWAHLRANSWYVAQDGVLRYWEDTSVQRKSYKIDVRAGDPVFGLEIRDELTPKGGKVILGTEGWMFAKEWAAGFHRLFVNPMGFKAQQHFGEEHMVARTKRKRRWRHRLDHRFSVEELVYPADITVLEVAGPGAPESRWLSPEMDLALCMYQSHSVNAPAIANRALSSVLNHTHPSGSTFARRLIEKLGNSSYGRWDDDLATGRYQRTRSAARASGLWPKGLFDGPKAIMPKDLKG